MGLGPSSEPPSSPPGYSSSLPPSSRSPEPPAHSSRGYPRTPISSPPSHHNKVQGKSSTPSPPRTRSSGRIFRAPVGILPASQLEEPAPTLESKGTTLQVLEGWSVCRLMFQPSNKTSGLNWKPWLVEKGSYSLVTKGNKMAWNRDGLTGIFQ